MLNYQNQIHNLNDQIQTMQLQGRAGSNVKVSSKDGSGFNAGGSDSKAVEHLEKELKRAKAECEKLRTKEITFGSDKQELDGKYKELEKKYDAEIAKVAGYVKEKAQLTD